MFFDPQQMKAEARAHDIGDGIHRAHFVKVHFFEVDSGVRPLRLRPVAGRRRRHSASLPSADPPRRSFSECRPGAGASVVP